MFITKRSLPRRTFLRGMGTAVALPLLDAMVPSLTALAQTPARPRTRFGAVFIPNGAIMEQERAAAERGGEDGVAVGDPRDGYAVRVVERIHERGEPEGDACAKEAPVEMPRQDHERGVNKDAFGMH